MRRAARLAGIGMLVLLASVSADRSAWSGAQGEFHYAFDIPASVLASKYGLRSAGRTGAVKVMVSRHSGVIVPEEIIRQAVGRSLAALGEYERPNIPELYKVVCQPLAPGRQMVVTVGVGGITSANVRVYVADDAGALEGPLLGAGVAYNYRDCFVAYDAGSPTGIVVRGADIHGHTPTASIAVLNGKPIDCEPLEIAQVTKGDESTIFMLIMHYERALEEYRIVEVTDHVEDLVQPVKLKALGDVRRKSDLTEAEWRERRTTLNALSLKFQQTVLSRGGRPPHMAVHVGDPEATGSEHGSASSPTPVPK